MIDTFLSSFKKYSNNIAFQSRRGKINFGELKNHIDEISIDYSNEIILYLFENTIESITKFLALLTNNIVIPINSRINSEIEKVIEITRPTLIINNFEKTETTNKTDILELYSNLFSKSKSGLVLLTSGTTGEKKAVLHDTNKLLTKFNKEGKDFSTLLFMNLDHIGGIDTLFYCLSNGSKIVIPSERNGDEIFHLIEDYKVEVLPTTPSFLNLLLIQDNFIKYNLSSLKVITFGAERINSVTLKKIKVKLPNVKLIQKFGTSETGTLNTKSNQNDQTWLKLGDEHSQVRIIDGLLEIKSESSMFGYLNAASPFTDDGWYKTGDRVIKEGEYYKILGRDSDLINIGGEKVNPIEIEDIIMEIDFVLDVKVEAEINLLLGNILKAKVASKSDLNKNDQIVIIKKYLQEKIEKYKIPSRFIFVDRIIDGKTLKKTR